MQTCTRCVCDTTIPGIRFDTNGVCNFCHAHDALEECYPLGKPGEDKLARLVREIQRRGACRPYDCVVGLSGGTDSTYSLYLMTKLGLRPLAVHLDNTWDTDIAKQNVANAVRELGVPLREISCDWEPFWDLQVSFLKASVPEAEIPTDVAIHGALFQAAAEEGIQYVINGHSFRTEGVAPIGWTYMDGRYIQSVQRRFGSTGLQGFPNLTLSKVLYHTFVQRIRGIPVLNYVSYSKEAAREVLRKELGWTYYGGHHFESTYTHFIIACVLWRKFGIDKRKISLSAQVRSGQAGRADALRLLGTPLDVDEATVVQCINRLGLTESEFERIMAAPVKSFHDYPTYYPLFRLARWPVKIACSVGALSPIVYAKYYS